MLRLSGLLLSASVAALPLACSGKTEHGGASPGPAASPIQKPASSPSGAAPTAAAGARHLLMVVELEPAAHVARTLMSRSVELPLPRRRGPTRPAAWRVDVLSGAGALLFSAPVEEASTVRGEFPDASGQLRGVTAQKRVTAVTLRLPWLDGAAEVRLVSADANGERELGRVAYPQVQP